MVPDEHEVRDLTLLIRAGSTVLSQLCPKIAHARSYRTPYRDPLVYADRLAVLFVSKEDEVAAVSYARNSHGIRVHVLMDGQEPVEEQKPGDVDVCAVNKTAHLKDIYPRVAPVVEGKTAWLEQMLHGPSSLAEHCAQLELLSNTVSRSTKSERGSKVHDFMEYCLAQCATKILQRLKLKIPRSNTTFLEAFEFSLEPPQTSTSLSIPKATDAASPKMLEGHEDTLLARMNNNINGYVTDARGFKFHLNSDGHIILDEHTYPNYHKWVRFLLTIYKQTLEEILQCRNTGSKNDDKVRDRFRRLLVTARIAASDLGDMCHRSTTFRRYIRSAPIRARFIDAQFFSSLPQVSVPTETLNDLEYDGANPRDSFEILKWLGLSVQALDAARRMCAQLRRPSIGVKIRAIEVPKTMLEGQQADHMTFLHTIKGTDRDESAVDIALENLRSLCDDDENTGLTCFQTQIIDSGTFAASFAGTVHAACALAGIRSLDPSTCEPLEPQRQELIELVQTSKAFEKSMGISKRCCFFCNIYLQLRCGGSVAVSGTSARCFPWTPPPWERDVAVLRTIWERLRERLRGAFEYRGIWGISGSDSGELDWAMSDSDESFE